MAICSAKCFWGEWGSRSGLTQWGLCILGVKTGLWGMHAEGSPIFLCYHHSEYLHLLPWRPGVQVPVVEKVCTFGRELATVSSIHCLLPSPVPPSTTCTVFNLPFELQISDFFSFWQLPALHGSMLPWTTSLPCCFYHSQAKPVKGYQSKGRSEIIGLLGQRPKMITAKRKEQWEQEPWGREGDASLWEYLQAIRRHSHSLPVAMLEKCKLSKNRPRS